MSRDRILGRVRKLLALAQRAYGNEHEAAAAAAKAAALMDEHDITDGDLRIDPVVSKQFHVDPAEAAWVKLLGAAVANRCKVAGFYSATHNFYGFAGQDRHVELADSLFDFLAIELERLGKVLMAHQRLPYLCGAAHGINDAFSIEKARKDAERGESDRRSLVVASEAWFGAAVDWLGGVSESVRVTEIDRSRPANPEERLYWSMGYSTGTTIAEEKRSAS